MLVLTMPTTAPLLWLAALPNEHLALAILPPVQLKLLHGERLLRLLEMVLLQGIC